MKEVGQLPVFVKRDPPKPNAETLADHVDTVLRHRMTTSIAQPGELYEFEMRQVVRAAIVSYESANSKLIDSFLSGEQVILPKNKDHAIAMLRVATHALKVFGEQV